MSTLTGAQDETKIESEKDLAGYFRRFAKDPKDRKIGLEAEFFAVHPVTGQALSYEGERGIEAFLKRLSDVAEYDPLLEDGRVIGLKRGSVLVALEPGGQIELSAPPLKTLREIQTTLQGFLSDVQKASSGWDGFKFLSCGIQPFSRLEEISWVPKRRYRIMAEYFQGRGELSHHMMKRTATNQFNFDYTSEADALEMLRAALLVSPIASALFANSGFSMGQPNGYATERVEIWRKTDPSRTGLLSSFAEPGKSFQDYLEYLLEMPMIFIVRSGQWVPVPGLTFRQYIQNGFLQHRATLSDFELHLSTAFPEVRFKQYLEIRGMDAQPVTGIISLAGFWKGILYDQQSRTQALDLLNYSSAQDRARLFESVPRQGLEAKLGNRPIRELAKDLVTAAQSGLRRLGEVGEPDYLSELARKIIETPRGTGQDLVRKWTAEFHQMPELLIQELSAF